MNKFYIYRFLDGHNKTIYIGRTNNLHRRLEDEHFSHRGHLDDNCYRECRRIEYLETSTETEMMIYELYLINKHNPKYNIANNNNDDFTFALEEDWILYRDVDVITKKEYKLYSHLIMMSSMGKNTTIISSESLLEGLKWKQKGMLRCLLESLEQKGYIRVYHNSGTMVISHGLKELKFPTKYK